MRMHVRQTKEADASALPAIERSAAQAFRSIPELAWIADGAVLSVEAHIGYARTGSSWVAVDEADLPIGFLSAMPVGQDLHIWELAVQLDRQRNGVGRALVETAMAYAYRLGLAAITLTTFRDVPWNEPFYTGFGFDILETDRMGERLADVLWREAEHGLPRERRCAMHLRIADIP